MAGMSAPASHQFDVSVQAMEDAYDLPPEEWTEAVVVRALDVAEAPSGSRVSVVFAGDEVVRELNREHRGLDETTDVLAFSFAHEGEYYGEPDGRIPVDEMPGFALPPGEPEPLGEVIVSYPQAVRQAAEAGRTVRVELAALAGPRCASPAGLRPHGARRRGGDEGPGKPRSVRCRPVIGYAV